MSKPAAALAAGLETALNRYLSLDPDLFPLLAELAGVVIAIEPQGLGLTLYLFPDAQGIRIADAYDGEPTVRIRGAPLALLQQWRGQPAELAIEGDAVIARRFQTVLNRLDIDWEEQLAQVVGDHAAHQLGRFWRALQGWGRQTSTTLLQDGGEYLQHELRVLPPRSAVEAFLSAVDDLREDVGRLEARVIRLRQWSSEEGSRTPSPPAPLPPGEGSL